MQAHSLPARVPETVRVASRRLALLCLRGVVHFDLVHELYLRLEDLLLHDACLRLAHTLPIVALQLADLTALGDRSLTWSSATSVLRVPLQARCAERSLSSDVRVLVLDIQSKCLELAVELGDAVVDCAEATWLILRNYASTLLEETSDVVADAKRES